MKELYCFQKNVHNEGNNSVVVMLFPWKMTKLGMNGLSPTCGLRAKLRLTLCKIAQKVIPGLR